MVLLLRSDGRRRTRATALLWLHIPAILDQEIWMKLAHLLLVFLNRRLTQMLQPIRVVPPLRTGIIRHDARILRAHLLQTIWHWLLDDLCRDRGGGLL